MLQTNSLASLMKHLSLKYSVITLDSERSFNSQRNQKSPQKLEKIKKTYLKNINNFDSEASLEGRRTQQKMNIKKEKQKAKELEQSKVSQNQNSEEYIYELHSRNEALRNQLIQLRQLARQQENLINIMASKLN